MFHVPSFASCVSHGSISCVASLYGFTLAAARAIADSRFQQCLTADEWESWYEGRDLWSVENDPVPEPPQSGRERGFFVQNMVECSVLYSERPLLYAGSPCELLVHPKCTKALERLLRESKLWLPRDAWRTINPFYLCEDGDICKGDINQ